MFSIPNETGLSDGGLPQDYQTQLMLLEQRSKKEHSSTHGGIHESGNNILQDYQREVMLLEQKPTRGISVVMTYYNPMKCC